MSSNRLKSAVVLAASATTLALVVPIVPGLAALTPASAATPSGVPAGHLTITADDLAYILDQIKIGEAHAARTTTPLGQLRPAGTVTGSIVYPYDVTSADRCLLAADIQSAATPAFGATGLTNTYPYLNTEMWGLRQVDGQCNNITNVQAQSAPTGVVNAVPATGGDTSVWGAADQTFPRLAPAANNPSTPYTLSAAQQAYQSPTVSVKDPTPRIISNLIADQSDRNPAAVAASNEVFQTLYGTDGQSENAVNATTGAVNRVMQIPNVTSDFNSSAGYNSWFTLFGQFYDHGLDLIPKAGASVFIPLMQNDPLYVDSPSAPNFMVLTRAADGSGESINSTTPYVDQSQSYGSHASQNFFLREYAFAAGTGAPSSTGRLLDGTDRAYTGLPSEWLGNPVVGGTLEHPTGSSDSGNGGLPTWKDIKAQARLLGFSLSDYDVNAIPVIATDQYGTFIPGPGGMPMMLFTNGSQYAWVNGSAASPVSTGAATPTTPAGTSLPGLPGSNWVAVSSGHVFINDTMSAAVPFGRSGQPLRADADAILDSPSTVAPGYYDDENLDGHYVAGDGRVNENIGLSSIHHVFHSEHNTVAADITTVLATDPGVSAAVRAEWNGSRLYQAARFVNEMEYQHMVFDEFIRRISPNLPAFLAYDPTVQADITAEFASAVYRLGHSMLNETIARSNPGEYYDSTDNQDVSLLTGFTNPAQARLVRPAVLTGASRTGSTITYTLKNGELSPRTGAIVTVSGLSDTGYNVTNGVVSGVAPGSFDVSTRYAGGSSASPVALDAAGDGTTTSTHAVTDGAPLANAAINDPGAAGFDYTPGSSAAAIAQGMSAQRGNEIDEFTTDAVRNNLLGLPLDLASLNITRGRDTGLPTLNQFRKQNASALAPYTSWRDFIAALRYQASGVNFIAAYGRHPSITAPVAITDVTSATATDAGNGAVSITYSVASTGGLSAGDIVSVSGLSGYDVANAVVASVGSGSFTVTTAWSHAPSAVVSFPSTSALRADAPAPIHGSAGEAAPTGASASVSREPSTTERRQRAQDILDLVPSDASDFLNGTGDWASNETGIDDIDLWMGGLAESPAKQPVTPPVLGTTFQFVFEDQSLKLQDGDRFYYLGRILGTNLGEEIPAQKLTDIVRRNTPSASATTTVAAGSGILGMNSPGFSVSDCAWSTTGSLVPASAACAAGTMTTQANGTLVHSGLDNTTGFGDPAATGGVRLTAGGGDDAVFGSAGNDVLNGGIGGDLIDGSTGNDRILGMGGEDLARGGPGNDVVNGGDSQAGDILDGNSGDDVVHCGNCTGAVASAIGETGNDVVQGGKNADLLLEGGEGDDWVEGLGGADILQGDMGFLGGGADPALRGGNDVANGGAGVDIVNTDAGDDVVNAGDSADAIDTSFGFDWIDYQFNKRLDNGGAKPGVWLDLSGINPNPLNNNGDAVLNADAVSGSNGPDVLNGSFGTDVTVPSASGTAGSTVLVLPGAWPQIVGGMLAKGTGIAAHATVVGPGAIAVVNGVTTTTVDLTVENTGTVVGPIAFTTWPLTNPGLFQGLTPLLRDTKGWTKYTAVDPNATTWSGGTLLFGGGGNDRLRPVSGDNVLHGSSFLRTCISVTHNSTPYTAGSDMACGSGRGYSTVSLLAAALDAGTVLPSDLTVVREIARTGADVTAVTTTGAAATYTATGHGFTVGDVVSVLNASNPVYNVASATVTAVTASTFTVASTVAAATAVPLTSGRALATDTLMLPNAEDLYTVVPLTSLPAGATSGFRVTGPTGFVDTVYDVELVSYAGLAAKPLTGTGSSLASLSVSSAAWTPAFSSATTSYSLVVPTATTSVNVQAMPANLGSTMTLNGTALATSTARAVTLSTTGPTTLTLVVTAPDRTTRTTYTLTVLKAGITPAVTNWVTTATGYTFNVTNITTGYTFACVTSGGTCTAGTLSGTTMPYTVTGVANGTAATSTVTATRAGYTTGTSTVTGSPNAVAGITPTFSAPVRTANGFTVNVTDYDAAFTFAPSVTVGSVSLGTPSGTTLPITVSGLLPSQASTLAVVASRVGYTTASASVSSSALVGTLTPALVLTGQTTSGFTASMTNWVTGYTYTCAMSVGKCTVGTAAGGALPITVTGLSAGQASTLTVRAARTGATTGSSTLSAAALLAGRTSTFSPSSRSGTTVTVNVTNYDPNFAYVVTSSNGTVSRGLPVGASLPITITGASSKTTVTVSTYRIEYAIGTSTANV